MKTTVVISNWLDVDDVKIETEFFEGHLAKLTKVAKNVSKFSMSFSSEKITLCQSTIKYSGFKIRNGVINKGDKYDIFFHAFNQQHIGTFT